MSDKLRSSDVFPAKLRGKLSYQVIDRSGRVIETCKDDNLIVDVSKEILAALLGGSGEALDRVGVGTGTAAAQVTDTSLTGPFYKVFDSVTYPDTGEVTFNWSIDFLENNGMSISEFGLFNASNEMFSRKVRSTPIVKDSELRITGAWTIIF